MSWNDIPQGFGEQKEKSDSSAYTKFPDRETTTVRILCEPEIGLSYWSTKLDEEGKDKRVCNHVRYGTIVPDSELEVNKWGKLDRPKEFMAFVVYNYGRGEVNKDTGKKEDEGIQLMDITQKQIIGAIKALKADKDYGDPVNYDLKITRNGVGTDTKYTTLPGKEKPADKAILDEYKNSKIDLSKLFTEKTVKIEEKVVVDDINF
jgi:hypothetical protein